MHDFKLSDFFTWLPNNNWREPSEAEKLFEICKSCPDLKLSNKFCLNCFCYMPKKVYYKNYHCPLQKW